MNRYSPTINRRTVASRIRNAALFVSMAIIASACGGELDGVFQADAQSNATTTLVGEQSETTPDPDTSTTLASEPTDDAPLNDIENIPAVGNLLDRSLEPCDDSFTCLHPQIDDAVWSVPVLSIRYMPDMNRDGMIDAEESNWTGTIDELDERIDNLEIRNAWWSTEATRYRGHSDDAAVPSLGFEVIGELEFINTPPRGLSASDTEALFFPDYKGILESSGICDWVDNRGVREVWLYTHHHGDLVPSTSKFSSQWGDISNSPRTGEMPRCENPYTLYNYNLTRGLDMMLLNRSYQVSALLAYQSDAPLFLDGFVGGNEGPYTGETSCGSPIWAPGAANQWNSWETDVVSSDCGTWAPGGGTPVDVTCATWFEAAYGDPQCNFDGGVSFFVWWMQNLPGHDNGLTTTEGQPLTNWWEPVARLEQVGDNDTWLTTG